MKIVIEIARKAGFHVGDQFVAGASEAELEHFASLVRADEREACAKVCEELLGWNEDDPGSSAAQAIRARSQS